MVVTPKTENYCGQQNYCQTANDDKYVLTTTHMKQINFFELQIKKTYDIPTKCRKVAEFFINQKNLDSIFYNKKSTLEHFLLFLGNESPIS